jgi:hypothetical protein
MKNVFRVFGIVALAAVIGLSFAGCDTGGGTTPAPAPGPAGPAAPQKTVYTWVAGDDSYSLEITEASNSRAVYTPKSGDTYVLTITLKAGGTQKSSGAVAVSNNSGTDSTLTLTPAGASEPFTVTVEKTATNALVTGMAGTITLEGGTETINASEKKVTPVKEYQKLELKANRWTNDDGTDGESWEAIIDLSDFTAKKPENGDKFTFRLSGTKDKPFKMFNLHLCSNSADDFQFFGWASGKGIPLSGTFNETYTVTIDNPKTPNYNRFMVHMENFESIPANIKDGDVVTTIRNFRISLVPNED